MRGTETAERANADAWAAWDGAEGDRWLEHEATYDRSVARYDAALLAGAAVAPGDRVLDVGCGTGETSRQVARRTAPGEVLGIDLSGVMVAHAARRAAAEGLANARYEQADAQVHPFAPGAFDVVVSRTGTMFFEEPATAFANLATALRPGGRLALLAWQSFAENPWLAAFLGAAGLTDRLPAPPPDAPSPFSLADSARVRWLLSAGFGDVRLMSVREPMWFGPDAEAAFGFVSGLGAVQGLLGLHDDAGRARALAALRATLEAHDGPGGVTYPSACWVVTATRA